jgi:hypothetical protein
MIQTRSRPNFTLLYLLLLAIVFAIAAPGIAEIAESVKLAVGSIQTMYSHGGPKHGPELMESLRDCVSNDRTIQIWHNPTTGRSAYVCKLGPKFGLLIAEVLGKDANGKDILKEITGFLKDKLKTIEQVERYLRNQGYQPLQ